MAYDGGGAGCGNACRVCVLQDHEYKTAAGFLFLISPYFWVGLRADFPTAAELPDPLIHYAPDQKDSFICISHWIGAV